MHTYITPLEVQFLPVSYQWNASHYLPSRAIPANLGVKIPGSYQHTHAGFGLTCLSSNAKKLPVFIYTWVVWSLVNLKQGSAQPKLPQFWLWSVSNPQPLTHEPRPIPLCHLCSTFHTVSLWSLSSSSSYPTTRMSSMMPNMFGMSLKVSSIFGWNMLSAGATPNGSHLYLYPPNWHAIVLRYDDLSSNFRLWYLELASMINMYLTLLSFGNMSFSIGPLSMGLINVWSSHAESKHSLTLPLALGTSTKLLHHLDISSTPSGAVISCCCSLSNSFWTASLVHMLHILVAPGMPCYPVLAVRKMCLQRTQCH